MEILRADDDLFLGFWQLYMTTAYPGVVKAWRAHHRRVDHSAVVRGTIKLVLYDSRQASVTYGEVDEFYLGMRIGCSSTCLRGFYRVSSASGMKR